MSGYNFRVTDGYDLSGYDQELVHKAQGGAKWDHHDQARYDAMIAQKQANTPAPEPDPEPVPSQDIELSDRAQTLTNTVEDWESQAQSSNGVYSQNNSDQLVDNTDVDKKREAVNFMEAYKDRVKRAINDPIDINQV